MKSTNIWPTLLWNLLLVSSFSPKSLQLRRLSTLYAVDDWLNYEDCEILLPANQRIPKAVIHFTGGFIAGSAVSLAYTPLLRYLSLKDYLIVATPIPPLEFNHAAVSEESYKKFIRCYDNFISPTAKKVGTIPIIGLSHSLGGKLLALSSSKPRDSLGKSSIYRANIFLSFNNFGAKDSIDIASKQASKLSPELQQLFQSFSFANIEKIISQTRNSGFLKDIFSTISSLSSEFPNNNNIYDNKNVQKSVTETFDSINNIMNTIDRFTKDLEFNPSPEDTLALIQNQYQVKNNILFQFASDEIDQSLDLAFHIRKSGQQVELIKLPGSHVTPNVIDMSDKDSIFFLKELVRKLDSLSDMLWESNPNTQGNNSRERYYYLPGSQGSSSPGGLYLPSGGDEPMKRWDSDDF